MGEQWHEVGDRVFVRRHESYDLNVGLVVGDGHCLVLDTRETHQRASHLVAAIRKITPDPWTVVNSHAHFDHYFGNAMFVPAEIWAHARAAEEIERDGEAVRDRVAASREPEAAEVEIVVPDQTFTDRATLDIGGRPVHLRYFGRGHTDNDIVVHVPDAGVIFAGDLVEEGAPPAFDDGYPLDWPGTLTAMLAELPEPMIVPGHGAVVDRAFVAAQLGELATTADLARRAHVEGLRDLISQIPYPQALERAFLQLDSVS
ncbi:MBL fold metallo-hydrolase [Nonomuraea africana]|uniref:Glyoxylase-like metal-dependent hydrolase (Beta-lactamase superfamily II) n=1 Tax=Nonomuraea africana TaxID=46171 RepID=A0ABR9KSP4_9ACTN|nr:MBL fold metallo-hydrolase [Nonomuraea africana]MBE1564507.1 glyoxylase-like metal-dependent hydrolase (beta-lactamase superfamily II) [Nonomuraea africana]